MKMRQTSMSEIFSLFPADMQKQLIVNGLELMLAGGEWHALEDIMGAALRINLAPNLRAHIIAIGVNTALRLRMPDLALKRFDSLAVLEADFDIELLQAQTFNQMLGQMPPGHAGKFSVLWSRLIRPDLPEIIQKSLAESGVILAGMLAKNRDAANLETVKMLMKKYLSRRIYNSVADKLR